MEEPVLIAYSATRGHLADIDGRVFIAGVAKLKIGRRQMTIDTIRWKRMEVTISSPAYISTRC
jgi:hypothetical protein